MSCWHLRRTVARERQWQSVRAEDLNGIVDTMTVAQVLGMALRLKLNEEAHGLFVAAMVECKYAIDERDAEHEWCWFRRSMSPTRFAIWDNCVCWANRVRIDVPVWAMKQRRKFKRWRRRHGKAALSALASIAVIMTSIVALIHSCRP